jgi:hypothetical protein
MSRIFKVKTSKRVDMNDFIKQLFNQHKFLQSINRSPTCYFYEEGYSTRGIDVTEEANGYEVRMTTLSNANDYLLCNTIIWLLHTLTGGTVFNEDDKELYAGKVFSDKDIADNLDADISILKALLNRDPHKEPDIVIYGPVRPFHFGRKMRDKVNALTGDKYAVAYKLSNMLLRCQFPPAEFEQGSNLLEVTNKDDTKYLLQIFRNSKNMLLENVKRIILSIDEEESGIYIEPKVLVQFLPESWELVDEYTVLAKQLPQNLWKSYYESMRPFHTPLKG